VTRLRGARQRAGEIVRLSGLALWRGFLGFYNSDDLTHAASIAYFSLLSLFPFSMLALSIMGAVTASEENRTAVLDFALRYFPRQFDFITVQLDSFRAHSVSAGVIGTIALVWGALGVFGAVTTAVNYAWRAEQPHGYWQHKLFSFTMMLVAGLLLVAALLLVSASQVVDAWWFADILGHFPGLQVLRGIALRYASTALFIVVVGLIFYFLPNTRVRFRDVWIGAFLTGLLWRGALLLFSWYVSDMTRFSQVNGSIAAVAVFLLWVYVQAVILLFGAEFTAAYARLCRTRNASRHGSGTV
jgi:membrane protein